MIQLPKFGTFNVPNFGTITLEPDRPPRQPSRTSGPPVRLRRDLPWQSVKPGACTVAVRAQLIKVAKTQSDYQTIVNLYRKQMDLFRTALGRGG